MSSRKTGTVALLGIALASAIFPGCSSGGESDGLDSAARAIGETDRWDKIQIGVQDSPSGSEAFTFCAEPAPGSAVNLTNAAWLAMTSANEYAHLGYFGPQLLSLGFGNPKGGDVMWAQCGLDLGRMRDFETTHEDELEDARRRGPAALVEYMRNPKSSDAGRLGACAKTFISDGSYTGRDLDGEPALPSAAFRDYLLRTSDDTNWIQFFSGRPYSFIERLLSKGSTQVVIARHATKPVVVIAFRGTESPDAKTGLQARHVVDLVTDVSAWKTDLGRIGFSDGWGSAHNGWVSALQSVDDLSDSNSKTSLLTKKVTALTDNDDKVGVWVTGHSLGGAVATLMAARLLDQMDHGAKFKLRGLYTFGSPIVGDEKFGAKLVARAAAHGAQIVRFRNDDDIVTSVPFSPTGKYRHAGTLAFLQGDRLGMNLPEEPRYTRKNLTDHDITGFVLTNRERRSVSGYYSRILSQMRIGGPDLDACASK